MNKAQIVNLLQKSYSAGWVLEPDVKKILAVKGLDVPSGNVVTNTKDASDAADKLGYPVVAKIVSHQVMHKSEVHGVYPNITTNEELITCCTSLLGITDNGKILIEEKAEGIELFIGMKNDHQFGPVILLGLGGTSVEIYHDITIRMAPLKEKDVVSMIESLVGKRLIYGYRGSKGINLDKLTELMITFSELCMTLESYMESCDLNPVICSEKSCVIADARLILKKDLS